MRILLVEDDPEQSEPLQAALTRSGHVVDVADDGHTAQWLMGETRYDLVILDWMLPGMDGLALCQHYRQQGHVAPILLLTAKDTTADKVAGLDSGADDYLVKPVDLEELLARVRALRRRSPLWQDDQLQVGDLCLNLDTMQLRRGDTCVQLSSREFQLLEYLMRHPQQILSHDQMVQALWSWENEPESNAIATRVRRLRRQLQAVQAADWIENVYGAGYRLVPPPSS
jgi:DNA-binding response OmpR family regulator